MERVALCAELLFLAELSAEDVREKKVSVYKVLVFTVLALIYRAFTNQLFWMEMIINLVPGGMMILLAILTKEGIGYGDGMTVMVLGLWTNVWFTTGVLCVAILLSGIFGSICLIVTKREVIPFVPFLLVGLEVMLFYA
ncbi:MAG: prepilin peptidase [Suilimivivens sp.]|nr:prepilin peptidase [Lachnospiraceae bacterium]